MPLKYGGIDKSLSDKQRINIEAFEDRRADAKVEYFMAVDNDGNVVAKENRGGKGGVSVKIRDGERGQIGSHIHPRGSGMLGGTFSGADIDAFSMVELDVLRARAKEGTYSISKRFNFNASGLIQYEKEFGDALRKEYRAANKQVEQQYREGSINYEEANTRMDRNFNRLLVRRHEKFIEGQSKYGYDYTLEKPRRK